MSLQVLYEDNHLLAVNKPAGLPTMGVAAGQASLLEIAREYVRQKYQKPGNVYLGAVSRLDAPVTGVTLLARTSKAAARLAAQFRERSVEKTYWAIVAGSPNPRRGELLDWLIKDERHRRMHVAHVGNEGAQEARLAYELLHEYPGHSLLRVDLETGRKHQIRLQFSSRGHPIVGDRKYDSDDAFPAGIALHARRLVVEHPTLRMPVEIVAPLPKSWAKWVPTNLEEKL
jgi:23S rRNA pseudouridine1911/1915/1917 synthase